MTLEEAKIVMLAISEKCDCHLSIDATSFLDVYSGYCVWRHNNDGITTEVSMPYSITDNYVIFYCGRKCNIASPSSIDEVSQTLKHCSSLVGCVDCPSGG